MKHKICCWGRALKKFLDTNIVYIWKVIISIYLKVILPASENRRIRQNMEESIIGLNGALLNKLVDSKKLSFWK